MPHLASTEEMGRWTFPRHDSHPLKEDLHSPTSHGAVCITYCSRWRLHHLHLGDVMWQGTRNNSLRVVEGDSLYQVQVVHRVLQDLKEKIAAIVFTHIKAQSEHQVREQMNSNRSRLL